MFLKPEPFCTQKYSDSCLHDAHAGYGLVRGDTLLVISVRLFCSSDTKFLQASDVYEDMSGHKRLTSSRRRRCWRTLRKRRTGQRCPHPSLGQPMGHHGLPRPRRIPRMLVNDRQTPIKSLHLADQPITHMPLPTDQQSISRTCPGPQSTHRRILEIAHYRHYPHHHRTNP